MRAVIVDDEYYAIERLKMILSEIDGIEIVGTFENGGDFLQCADALRPDVVFLDIEMPGNDGFQVVESLSEKTYTPYIIFVTAFKEYALSAFEVNAADYILKPVEKERLVKAIARVKPVKFKDDVTIKVNCFKYFSTTVNGKTIDNMWKTQKTEELFAYLLCSKGKYISKERIAEELWPEVEPEKAISNFYTAQYFLKKQFEALGIRSLLQTQRGKIAITYEDIECDIFQFDNAINSLKENNMEVIEKALDVYIGMIFENKFYSWATNLQQHYEIEFEKLLRFIIEYYKVRGIDDKAEYYSKKAKLYDK